MVLQLTPTIGPHSTGLGIVTLELTKALIQSGANAKLWCVDDDPSIQWACAWSGVPRDKISGFKKTGFGLPALSFEMERAASNCQHRDVRIAHQHGMWTGVSRVTNALRKACGAITIVAPHGSLDQWSLRKSRWKKRLALAWYEARNLRMASCLHALRESEVARFRDFGLRNPIAIIPNGISDDWLRSTGDGESFRRQFGISSEQRILLFLSRISPVKGLLMLLEAIQSIQREFEDWCLVVAGANEFNHQETVEHRVAQLGLGTSVKFVGPLFGSVKRNAFAAADLFILPSHSEGAPIVILEALGAGVPVIATQAAPWQELEVHQCGWWPEISASSISQSLEKAIRCNKEALQIMGRRGNALVSSKYSWRSSAQRCIELYDWLLGNAEKPAFVTLE
jgi:glycosyltransferase involved in cell wall biosynthesis